MKVLILEAPTKTTGYCTTSRTIPKYDRLLSNEITTDRIKEMYDESLLPAMLGYVVSSKSDFIRFKDWESFVRDESIVKNYDVVVTISHCLSVIPNSNQLFCYMEPEPPSLVSLVGRPVWNMTDQLVDSPYDFLLNNYTENTNEKTNISCPYCYDIDYYDNVKKPDKLYFDKTIFIQKRTVLSQEFLYYLDNRWGLLGEKYGSYGDMRNYKTYISHLKNCEFAISLDPSEAAGQVIAECCLLGIPVFSPPHKLFTRLLMPKYLHCTTEEEVFHKSSYFKEDPEFRLALVQEILNNRHKLALNNFPELLQVLYERKMRKSSQ